jgi:flagellar biosynthesis protein FliR
MRLSETQLLAMVAQFVWPFLRVGALFLAIPIFSGHSVPVRVRTLVALLVTLVIVPTLPPMPEIALFSLTGFLVGIQQVLIGVMFGFVLNLIFQVVVFGGQSVAYNMGLGFANLIDPTSGVQVPVIAQFYLILATLLFLDMDGHLLAIRLLAESFTAIPVEMTGLTPDRLWGVSRWSARLFAAGTLMSLPIIAALLLVNLGFGVASRSAPQLNIFSVGFPISLLLGLALIWIGLPSVMNLFSGFMDEGYLVLEQMLK